MSKLNYLALASERAINNMLSDPATSDWLKEAIVTSLKRDALDAAIDATRLANLLAARQHAIRMQS